MISRLGPISPRLLLSEGLLPRAFPRDPSGFCTPHLTGAVGRTGHAPPPSPQSPARHRRRGHWTYREASSAVGGKACPHVCIRACPRPPVSARVPGRARPASRTDSGAPTGSAHGVGAGSGRLRLPPIAAQGGRPDARLTIGECAPGAGRGRGCPRARGCAWARVFARAPSGGAGGSGRLLGLNTELAVPRRSRRRSGAWGDVSADPVQAPAGGNPGTRLQEGEGARTADEGRAGTGTVRWRSAERLAPRHSASLLVRSNFSPASAVTDVKIMKVRTGCCRSLK